MVQPICTRAYSMEHNAVHTLFVPCGMLLAQDRRVAVQWVQHILQLKYEVLNILNFWEKLR